jgi:hypothetical protein
MLGNLSFKDIYNVSGTDQDQEEQDMCYKNVINGLAELGIRHEANCDKHGRTINTYHIFDLPRMIVFNVVDQEVRDKIQELLVANMPYHTVQVGYN